jgi:hypothetical protein
MSTIVITIDSRRTKASIKGQIPWGATLGKEFLNALSAEIAAIASGAQDAAIVAGIGASDPVRASGTLTVVYASLAAANTVTVAGTVLTCIDTGTPTSAQFKKETSGTVTAANLAAAINGNSAIAARVSATSSGAVVTVRAHVPGTVGNLIPLVSSAGGVTVSAATLASGAGGADEAPLSFSFGK